MSEIKKKLPKFSQKRIENCEKKPKHTKKSAQTVRNHERDYHGNMLECYHCPICNHWHLTTKKK